MIMIKQNTLAQRKKRFVWHDLNVSVNRMRRFRAGEIVDAQTRGPLHATYNTHILYVYLYIYI